MSESSQNVNILRLRIFHIIFTVLLVCVTCSSSRADGEGPESWFGWLFDLFSAEDIPQRPALTEQDHMAIKKAKVLLGSYSDDTAKSLMLGVLAAANGNEADAQRYFLKANELDTSRPLLPLTMAAQVHVQEGNYKAAKILHQRVLHESDTSPSLQRINAHLDLAVACSKLDEPDEAKRNIKRAERLIGSSRISEAEKALAYLQSGTVYKKSIKDSKAALRVWKAGQVLSARAGSRLDARLALQLNMAVVENLPATASLTVMKQYLSSAEKAANRLSGESKVVAQLRLGEQFTKLAVQRRTTPDAQLLSSEAQRLLKPARELNLGRISSQMIRVKAKAIKEEQTLAKLKGDTAKMDRLKIAAEEVKEGMFIRQVAPRRMVPPIRRIP